MGLIYLDTCLVIYLAEEHPVWAPAAAAALEAAARAGDVRLGISPLVKSECLIDPSRRADVALQSRYAAWFERFLTLDMPEPVFLAAAQLRARFGLKMPDALHLACAQHHGAVLWTNDERLARAAGAWVRNVL
ncbi:type II toxin-antitoxin system VapC family toxin [Xylophilus sp.]|uniref:type II toxin-antitoxin system VapC family toxin n=1 Tax=Xylophilus sp. TaxID=2653893 RepID=UPI0013B96797|nr:PIN domain-containing protein [Xylophilus sp.]KAF1047073.1 MAG: tRNA(fMet)-specific endonuclease VapC [Xylophilus sp.]